jgi:outer membrane protein assembly factor BamB
VAAPSCAGFQDNNFMAFNGATGQVVWTVATSGPVFRSSAAIGSDGTVYVGNEDGALIAFD